MPSDYYEQLEAIYAALWAIEQEMTAIARQAPPLPAGYIHESIGHCARARRAIARSPAGAELEGRLPRSL